jgi:hypothetical protein
MLAAMATAGSVVLGLAAASIRPTPAATFFLATSATATISLLVLRAEYRRADFFSPIGLIAVYYLLAFVAGGIYAWLGAPGVDQIASVDILPTTDREALSNASVVGLLSLCAVCLGYRLHPLRIVNRILPKAPTLDRSRLAPLVGVLLATGWFGRMLMYTTGSYFHIAAPGSESLDPRANWFVTAATLLPLFATALVGAAAYTAPGKEARTTRLKAAFWTLALIELAWAVPSGARGAVVALMGMILIVRYYGASRLPSRRATAIGLATLVLFFFPFAEEYRNAGAYQENPSTAARSAFETMAQRSLSETLSVGTATTVNRFADITSVAKIANTPGNQTRFASGESLRWIPETLVPRFLYPDKYNPGQFGNEFGRSYGITYSGNFDTSIAISQPGELLLNFGVLGVLLGMPLVGGVYRILADFLSGRRGNFLILALYGTLAWELLSGQEVIIAHGLAGVIKAVVVVLLVTVAVSFVLGGLRPTSREKVARARADASAPLGG